MTTDVEYIAGLIARHRHLGAGREGVANAHGPSASEPAFVHPLDPQGAGGQLALFIVEALDTIIRNQETMHEQLNRVNALVETLGSKLGNFSNTLQGLKAQFLAAADPDTDNDVDLTQAADHLQSIIDEVDVLSQAIANSSSAAALPQGGDAGGAAPTDTGSTDTGSTDTGSTDTGSTDTGSTDTEASKAE